MEDILKKIKTDYQFFTGFSFAGILKALGTAFASRIKEFLDKLLFIKKQAFIETADKDYLYLHASILLPPEPALTATGIVVCYGVDGYAVPKNTQIQDDNGVLTVISESKIALTTYAGNISIINNEAILTISNDITNTTALINGVARTITVKDENTISFNSQDFIDGQFVTIEVYRANVQVIANEPGVLQNRPLNTAMKLKKTEEGINTDCSVLIISGGVDAEEVEVYRQRVKNFIANPQAPFNKTNIIYENKKRQKTLKYVWVKGGEYIEGEVLVIALNNEFGLTSFEIQEIINNTVAIAPANFDITAVNAQLPIIENFNIVISGLIPVSEGLKNEIKKNLLYTFQVDLYEKDVTKENIEAVIYATRNGIEKAQIFTLVSGWKISEFNTFYRLQNVIFQ
jgi:uncharacterized phage protein gp47/JayE